MTGAQKYYVRTGVVACAVLAATLLVSSGPAMARARPRAPDGLLWGPWVFQPWISTDLEYDDNVRRDATSGETNSDYITGLEGEIEGWLGFRNSSLSLTYGAYRLDYDAILVERNLDQEFEFDLDLNFSTGDRLRFIDRYSRNFSIQELELEDGETINPGDDKEGGDRFIGEPFDTNRWEVRLTRAEPRRQGYDIRISRVDLNYQGDAQVSRYDYRGFDNSLEYRHPLPRDRWWTASYQWRRINHYNEPGAPPLPVGVSYRKEVSDNIQVGFRGELGEDQPFLLRLGYTDFELEGDDASFRGVVGRVQWTLALGAESDLSMTFFRRPLPSSSSTYYVNNILRTTFESEWRRNLFIRSELDLTFNRYEIDDEFCRREDEVIDAGIGATWVIRRRVGFDLSAGHYRRSSNCDSNDSESTTFNATLKVGWF